MTCFGDADKDKSISDDRTTPLLRRIFYEKIASKWEINFNIDTASESTQIPSSKSGKIFLEVFGYPVLDSNANLEYVVLQHYDITERKKAEQAIAQEKERLLVTLRSIGDGVITTNTKRQVVLINKVAEKLTGWTQKEALGKDIRTTTGVLSQKCNGVINGLIGGILIDYSFG